MGREPLRPHFYGRRKGHNLRPGRQHLVDTRLAGLSIPLSGTDGGLDPAGLFDRAVADIWFEIGFGAGEHLAHQARTHTDIGFLGAEPFINGVAKLLSVIDQEALENIRIFGDDVRLLLDEIAPESIGRVFFLYADPWPKKRHNRRRLFSHETLTSLARIMKPGAELRFASDDMNYIRWALDIAGRRDDFEWQVSSPEDWRRRPTDGIETRYEAKALSEGRRGVYLSFRRT